MNEGQEFIRWHSFVKDEEPDIARGVREKVIVCECCGGKGTTWHGWHRDEAATFTEDEWFELDEDDRYGYATGRYDGICPECNGKNVIATLDEDLSSPEAVESWLNWCTSARESANIERMERMMGA